MANDGWLEIKIEGFLLFVCLQVVWKNIHFLMWDIGGQESLRSAWNTYYTNTEV